MGHLFLVCSLFLGTTGPAKVIDSYAEGCKSAKANKRMLLIDFGTGVDLSQIEREHFRSMDICKLPAGYTTTVDGTKQTLSLHPSFSDMGGSEGVIVIDFKNDAYMGMVVSALPARHCTPYNVAALLDLPAATLTQRTMIWALRVHPEHPRSAWGTPCPQLMDHAARHSQVQANSNHQHHNMPMGIAQSEIVAESWSWNTNMVDAALDMVHAWRQSSGHWGAACRPYNWIGYDMKTIGNKWFATGVFRF